MEETVEEPDDAQTKFYKRHMKRTETPNATGRTPIFDFDEWNNQHYGKAFQRSQAARKRFADKPVQAKTEENTVKSEITILGGMAVLTAILYLMMIFDSGSPDETSRSTKNR